MADDAHGKTFLQVPGKDIKHSCIISHNYIIRHSNLDSFLIRETSKKGIYIMKCFIRCSQSIFMKCFISSCSKSLSTSRLNGIKILKVDLSV